MRNRTSRIVALTTGLIALVFATQTFAVDFNAQERGKLAEGKTVRQRLASSGDQGFYGGTGWTMIDAPADVVWAAIDDFGSYRKAFPKTVSVKELSRKGDKSLIRMKLGHKLISVEYHMTVERNRAKNMISFKLVRNRPHDIEETRGYWRLFPQKDGRTLVAYVVATQVPMGLVNLLGSEMATKFERHLLGLPGYLKKWVEGPNGSRYRTMLAKN